MEVFHIVWSSYDQIHSYVIGFIIYDNQWYFKYNQDSIEEAIKYGFRPFPSMEDITKTYVSDQLLTTFLSRYKIDKSSSMITLMKDSHGELITDKILIKHCNKEKSNNQ